MKAFKDNEERTWRLELNVTAIKRVRALTEVDLLGAVEGKLFERLVGDPILLCDVIYAACKPQADTDGVSDEDFGRAMAGEAIDAATTAFLQELVDFFPSSRRRILQKALEKVQVLEAKVLTTAEQIFDSDKIDKVLEEALEEIDPAAELKAALQRPPAAAD